VELGAAGGGVLEEALGLDHVDDLEGDHAGHVGAPAGAPGASHWGHGRPGHRAGPGGSGGGADGRAAGSLRTPGGRPRTPGQSWGRGPGKTRATSARPSPCASAT
jgi:hypothetical protein